MKFEKYLLKKIFIYERKLYEVYHDPKQADLHKIKNISFIHGKLEGFEEALHTLREKYPLKEPQMKENSKIEYTERSIIEKELTPMQTLRYLIKKYLGI
jgi:hypothetical protein